MTQHLDLLPLLPPPKVPRHSRPSKRTLCPYSLAALQHADKNTECAKPCSSSHCLSSSSSIGLSRLDDVGVRVGNNINDGSSVCLGVDNDGGIGASSKDGIG
jgi:hypothetical protein